MNGDKGRYVSARTLDLLFILQVALNIIVLCLIVGLLFYSIHTQNDVDQRQLVAIQRQNDIQLCAQHDITVAVRQIGRSLGLPTEDIIVPDIEGLDCP